MEGRIEQKIAELMEGGQSMKVIYNKYKNIPLEELLSFLVAQKKINEMIEEKPILKEVLIGYETLFNLNPIEIFEKIYYKTDIEIRTEFEELKKKNKIKDNKNIFVPENRNPFNSNA